MIFYFRQVYIATVNKLKNHRKFNIRERQEISTDYPVESHAENSILHKNKRKTSRSINQDESKTPIIMAAAKRITPFEEVLVSQRRVTEKKVSTSHSSQTHNSLD